MGKGKRGSKGNKGPKGARRKKSGKSTKSTKAFKLAQKNNQVGPVGSNLNGPVGSGQLVGNKKITICLCMIVKNESKIIERCLNAAKEAIDYVSICDTGSTDQTIEIIENWCLENNIEGKVHQEEFKNFCHNRT